MKLPEFTTQAERIAYLIKNKKELIEMKKAAIKFTDQFGAVASEQLANKALNTSHVDDLSTGIIKRTIIGNTYNWMDSHSDVHLDGLFSKSISERQDKIFHLHDHEQKITAKVGKPTKIYEKQVSWQDMGVNMPGNTMALMMDSNISKDMNAQVFGQYLSKEINQHSVGMIYVKIDLGVNDSMQKQEYATWQKHINQIANKERAMEQGYFWAVSEAKLIEISAVLAGSNELTPTIANETKELPDKKSTGIDYGKLGELMNSESKDEKSIVTSELVNKVSALRF